jgi:RNA polymerase sigma-70 factor (ECF subfamily)
MKPVKRPVHDFSRQGTNTSNSQSQGWLLGGIHQLLHGNEMALQLPIVIRAMVNTETLPIWPTAECQPQTTHGREPKSDHVLARAAAHGNMQAFEELYERHNRRVYSLCLRMTQNAAEAEDLAQEAFIQLFRKIGSFRGDSAFTTWLHRLTVNQVLMHFRKRSVKMERTTEEGETPVQIVRGTENQKTMPVLDRIALDKALAQLPPGYRTVFVLHDVEGHEHEEIAKLLGVAVGTSKSQLHKARMKLRRLLKSQTD